MKRINCLVLIFLPLFAANSSIYDLQLQTLEGNTIDLSSMQAKKILISSFSASTPDITHLQLLDSLQQADTSLRIIAFPAVEWGGEGSEAALIDLRDSLALHIIVARQTNVQKNAGENQHAVFKWLTHVQENTHFDVDVQEAGQLFIISKNGMLYSVLTAATPVSVITEVLNQSVE